MLTETRLPQDRQSLHQRQHFIQNISSKPEPLEHVDDRTVKNAVVEKELPDYCVKGTNDVDK